MNVFWPFSAKRLPRFVAIVVVRIVLLPASGSVIAKQKRVLPLQASGKYRAFCCFGTVFGDEAEAHRRADDEVQQRNSVVRQSLEEQMHFDHALAGAAIFLGHHGSDEAVLGDLLIERLGKHVLVGAFHPVFAIEFLRDRGCRIPGSAAARA